MASNERSARFTLNGPFFGGRRWKKFLYLHAYGVRTIGIQQVTQIRPCDDYIIGCRGNTVLECPELFANHTLHPVASDRVADLLSYRDSEPGRPFSILATREDVQHQIPVSVRVARTINAIEISATGKTATARLVPAGGQDQAERRRRPFLRRRLRIALPPREELRTRKPWVFERLRFLGW